MSRLTAFRLSEVVLVAGAVLVLFGATAYPQPRIEFEELKYNWGSVMEGERVTHAFGFQNTGNRLLKIEKVQTS